MQRHFKFSDDTEVSAAATNSPVEVRILVHAGAYFSSIGQYHCGSDHVVTAEAKLAHDRTDAASEQESSNTYGRTLTKHCGSARLCCCLLECAGEHASINTGSTLVVAKNDVSKAGHVEHKAALAA